MKKLMLSRASRSVIVFAILIGANSGANANENPQLFEDDLLILRLQAGRYTLSDSIIGYRTADGACLYLEDMIRELEFNIDLNESRAAGWFKDESKEFKVDFETSLSPCIDVPKERTPAIYTFR